MSLHIDLLNENERSNPSGKILMTTMITVAIAILIGLGLYVFQTFLMLQVSQRSLHSAQQASNTLKSKNEEALKLIKDVEEVRACITEITAFSNAQVQVAAQLYAIAVSIPADIQLTQLTINNSLVPGGAKNNLPARLYSGTMRGRTAQEGHEDRIRSTIASLREADGLFGTISAGGVSVFTEEKKNDARQTEIIRGVMLDIKFELEPRLYKQAAEGRPK